MENEQTEAEIADALHTLLDEHVTLADLEQLVTD